MKMKVVISLCALALLLAKLLWPKMQIDAIAIGLLIIAILPWISSFLESAKLPGGWELKFRNLEREFSQLKEEFVPIADSLTEHDQKPVEQESLEPPPALSDSEAKLLRALSTGGFPLRSVTGIANSAELDRDQVQRYLLELKNKGFAAEVQGRKGVRWAITPSGRESLGA